MVLNVATALQLVPYALSLIEKLVKAIATKEPVSIEEEIAALNEARLRPSEDIIAEADQSK